MFLDFYFKLTLKLRNNKDIFVFNVKKSIFVLFFCIKNGILEE